MSGAVPGLLNHLSTAVRNCDERGRTLSLYFNCLDFYNKFYMIVTDQAKGERPIMRFTAFDKDGKLTIGLLDDHEVVDLSLADPQAPADLRGLLQMDPEALARAARSASRAPAATRRPLAGLQFRPPIENAGKYFCLGLNYAAHAAEGGFDRPNFPTVFTRCSTSLVGHGQPLLRPDCSVQFDYEAELAAIIGKRARRVSQSEALDCVAGYSCFNDGSIRDYQFMTTQWTMGKNFDASGSFGPFFVSADELPPGAVGLRIQSRLNGRIVQDGNTGDMVFSVAETVSLLSSCCTLEPGDVIVMGTPAGVGFARKPPLWMKEGDVIEVEIERLGVLRNPIVDEAGCKL
jgi:acylpyruvate hydrolase